MEVLRELMKKSSPTENLAIGIFVIATLFTIFKGTTHTILIGVAFTLMVLGALPKQVTLAFLVGASVILLLQTRRRVEGFTSEGKEEKEEKRGSDAPTEDNDPDAAANSEHEKKEDEEEKNEDPDEKGQKDPKGVEEFSSGKPMLPDNTDRMEALELGKAYKLPNEKDDKGFHLDAGTTFLNAYKALKPDQIAAMTKDTQELLATQKSLIGMLDSFGPLMKDMGKITGFLGQ